MDRSTTSQSQKLGIKAGQRVSLDCPPAGWSLQDPPADLHYVLAPDGADLIVSFFRIAEELARRLPALTERVFPDGVLWVAWPRRAGGHESDITDTLVRGTSLALGVVDVKVAAIDEDWSGLKFVWRKAHRGGALRLR